jgi:hypothetical protein
VCHFTKVFGSNDLGFFKSRNPNSHIDIDLSRGISKIALNKCAGLDNIPGEWLKHPDLFDTLDRAFKFCVDNE